MEEILHQLVDGWFHYNPIIYHILKIVIISSQLVQAGLSIHRMISHDIPRYPIFVQGGAPPPTSWFITPLTIWIHAF
jgi:hypothetical protein